MQKVILINPPLNKEERYGKLASAGVYMPLIGIGFLASVLKKEGFEVSILDCEALGLDMEQSLNRISSYQPDFIGITAVTVSIYSAGELAAALKQKNIKAPIIVGGVHLSSLPEETMAAFSQFDIGVIGEGEVTIVELLKALHDNKDPGDVQGIIYRKKNGVAARTSPRQPIKNLDSLPFPAWDTYPDLKKYYQPSAFGFKKLPCTSLITSRGCPGRCSFCSKGVLGNLYREHSAEYVMGMIKVLYHDYGMRDLMIYDDTFGVNRRRLEKICQMLIDENLNLVWSCNFRAEMAKPEILRLMKRAGCWGIAYGIESCSQDVLNFLRKDITVETVARALTCTKEAGIMSKGYIMIGTLPDTEESILTTLNTILKFDLDILTVNAFTPVPGSTDYQRAAQYGTFNADWKLINQHNIIFVPHALSKEKIDYYIRLMTRKFYLRPRIIWTYLKMCVNPRYIKLLLNGFYSFLKFVLFKQ